MNPVEVVQSETPVILSMPHSGTHIPCEILARLNSTGHEMSDTDWYIDRLYEGLLPHAGQVKANFHRYVIDANRDPDNQSLYPGQNSTDLCPLTDFHGQPIYLNGMEPSPDEIKKRLAYFHQPYHAALSAEIARVCDIYGFVILYDCHSIRPELPFLFSGTLPDFNIGTNDDRSCMSELSLAVLEQLRQYEAYSSVLNGRFKGGWTTRHYGDPEAGVFAIQMELSQSTYMTDMDVPEYCQESAQRVREPLGAVLKLLEDYFR